MEKFNKEMLKLARLYRGKKQDEIGFSIGKSKGVVSKYEDGKFVPSRDDIEKISQYLNFLPAFFYQQYETKLEPVFRSNLPLKKHLLYKLSSNAKILHDLLTKLFNKVPKHHDLGSLRHALAGFLPARLATELRKHRLLGIAPISNMVEFIEGMGIIVCHFKSADKLDGFMMHNHRMPIIFANFNHSGEQIRLNLAVLLGHYLLNHDELIESENELKKSIIEKQVRAAHKFAMALLLPEKAIEPHTEYLNYKKLLLLKKQWQIPLKVILKRAFDLDHINESKYTSIGANISADYTNNKQPYPLSPEKPQLLNQILIDYKTQNKVDDQAIEQLCGLANGELAKLLNFGGRG